MFPDGVAYVTVGQAPDLVTWLTIWTQFQPPQVRSAESAQNTKVTLILFRIFS